MRHFASHFIIVTVSIVLISSTLLLGGCSNKDAEAVNVYSYRKENLIKPLLDRFTEKTGIKVNLVTGKADALFQRLKSEGEHSPADILLTVDAGRLHLAKAAGLLQATTSEVLTSTVPEHLRDPDNQWFGLSYRARVIMYNTAKVSPEELGRYEDLSDENWRKRLCMRSSSNIYNQSLLASMIAADGEAAAESWAKGIVANMVRAPKGNDRSQMSSVAIGECDVTLANTYYLGAWQNSAEPKDRELASKLGVFFPNQNDRGTHINISGAGITRYSKNPAAAQQLLEFLSSDESQQWYAKTNNEYPVTAGIAVSDTVRSWGYPFKTDQLNLSKLGELNATAVKAFDRAGWK